MLSVDTPTPALPVTCTGRETSKFQHDSRRGVPTISVLSFCLLFVPPGETEKQVHRPSMRTSCPTTYEKSWRKADHKVIGAYRTLMLLRRPKHTL